jgi:lipid-A-disaccharide synthase-like uncharacterized protein
LSSVEGFWLIVGFTGQALFTCRFLVQWIASERQGESVMPLAFWYFSLSGGWLLLLYAIYRRDPVIITGQVLGVVVYARNLVLIHRKRRAERAEEPAVVSLPARNPDLRRAG